MPRVDFILVIARSLRSSLERDAVAAPTAAMPTIDRMAARILRKPRRPTIVMIREGVPHGRHQYFVDVLLIEATMT